MTEKRLTFIDHLEELRRRILSVIACVGLGSIIGFIFARNVLDLIIQKASLESAYFFSPIEAFLAQIKVAIFLGVIISFPFILYQTWAFIGPGLTKKERAISLSYLGSGIILFIIGLLFGYFILIPLGLRFLLSFSTDYIQPLMNISKYLGFIFWCMLGSGFLFQLPLLLFFLMKLGIIDVKTVTKHRAEAIIVLLILCAVITPTGDFFTLLIISVPLLLLFELSILAARLTRRRRKDV
ncbi:MAG TPA: twin-arginine translocase subunit TatC [candidate division WOR-3 bacterium]|uniref:Sec-independent protein translocase protein TatC n=1 Tax=candidate division WOR-3 bacterium TaxID=2052148 RepID=A0A9C9JZA1_UNCW3|nr:twin-arginine translocase subunit TatC [candidate division WOR-3 bacterium]